MKLENNHGTRVSILRAVTRSRHRGAVEAMLLSPTLGQVTFCVTHRDDCCSGAVQCACMRACACACVKPAV